MKVPVKWKNECKAVLFHKCGHKSKRVKLSTNCFDRYNSVHFQFQEELGCKLHQVGTAGKVSAQPLVRLRLQ